MKHHFGKSRSRLFNRLFGCCLGGVMALFAQTGYADTFVIGNNRITFITENLVRLEYARHQQFLNDSTLFAVVRTDRQLGVRHEQKGSTFSPRKRCAWNLIMTVFLSDRIIFG